MLQFSIPLLCVLLRFLETSQILENRFNWKAIEICIYLRVKLQREHTCDSVRSWSMVIYANWYA